MCYNNSSKNKFMKRKNTRKISNTEKIIDADVVKEKIGTTKKKTSADKKIVPKKNINRSRKKNEKNDVQDSILPPPVDWHTWLMQGVYWVASKSKDPKTRIGAIIVKDNRIISTGYNGIPAGVNDLVEERNTRPNKYFWYEHAERNAILSAAHNGISTEGAAMYTNGVPCIDCARSIIQSGIKQVYVHSGFTYLCQQAIESKQREHWKGHDDITSLLFQESGVQMLSLDGVLGMRGFFNGVMYDV